MRDEQYYIQRIDELESELSRIKREVRLAEVRRRVTPHFLFNSISVSIGLVTQEPSTAVRFLNLLAKMYRYLLKYGGQQYVSIERELELMTQYYELMNLRHFECLRLDISDKIRRLSGYVLPPLSLQGILENAIKHNVHTQETPLTVKFDTDGEYIIVSNKIAPLTSETESFHIGMENINETMRLLFDKQIDVINDGSTFTVKIPLIKTKTQK